MTPSLDELFRRHAAAVLAYALRRADRASAEDVVSEVFLIAGRRLDRLPETDVDLWLYGVARRVLANQHRGGRRRLALARALADVHRSHASTSDHQQGPGPLLEALAALRESDREVLMLTAWEGLDATQVGVVVGCSPHAVHTRLHRARARLHAELVHRGYRPQRPAHSEACS